MLFSILGVLFWGCQPEAPKQPETPKQPEGVQEKPLCPFAKMPISFCSPDNTFSLTLNSFNNHTFTGSWFRIAGQTENGQDTREEEDIKAIYYDAAKSTLTFSSPVTDDTVKIVFTCVLNNNTHPLLVSKNFEFADTLKECK